MTKDDERFVPSGAGPWPLTPRTRFVMWRALAMVRASLGLDLAVVQESTRDIADLASDPDSFILNEFPVPTHSQPLEWWEQVVSAADRMAQAMRTGRDLAPRTPAEEVVLCMAAEQGWPDMVLDDLGYCVAELNGGGVDVEAEDPDAEPDPALRSQFHALEQHDDDFDWGGVLPALSGNTDVEQLWIREFAGIDDPDNEVNQAMRIGDYRPQAWHRLLDRRVGTPRSEDA